MKKQPRLVDLLTPEGEELRNQPKGFIPWNEYPRPRLKRDSFLCLNGEWELSGENFAETILVPFVPESILSGIGRAMPKGERLCYKRSFSLPEGFKKDRVILNFGAVDQIAEVYLNGVFLGMHIGGYSGFSFDITKHLDSENTLEVFVTDDGGKTLPYGKQREKRGGMWYTPTSGIWQTVWLESLPAQYISDVKVVTDCEKAEITVAVNEGRANGSVILHLDEGDEEFPLVRGRATITPKEPILWSPEEPFIYNVTINVGEDSASSYFALRSLEILNIEGTPRLCLNGKPYFFHGLLDQGYFSDGIYTPATPEGYEFDILKMKELGFNMLRKHIKIEPELFYYYCDKHGMVVFQDLVNSGKYNFLVDTALPTLGLKRGISHHASKRRRERFENDGLATLARLYNHPSVCYYTIFNEGWGQYDADRIYRMMKNADESRIFDATSGWFFEKESDVDSHHVYFKPIRLKKGERPLVLSEFGGYSHKIEGHSFNLTKNYGYKYFESAADFEDALCRLYLDEVVPAVKNRLCAAVLTQVSDVEDETNGLVTYDRKVVKVSTEKMKAIRAAIDKAVSEWQS